MSEELDRAQRRRLAAALRRLHSEVVASEAPDASFGPMAGAVDAWASELAVAPRRVRTVGLVAAGEVGSEGAAVQRDVTRFDYGAMSDFSPFCGKANPLSPPLRLSRTEEHAVGLVTFPPAFEGPPGHVHDGYVAAAFDEVFGVTQTLVELEAPAMTGKISVWLRAPCPLGVELRLEGRVERVQGRKVFAAATMKHGDTLVADAEAIMFKVDLSRYVGLADDRNEALGAGEAEADDGDGNEDGGA